MTHRSIKTLVWLAALSVLFGWSVALRAQSGSQGAVSVMVADSSGGMVPGALLQLLDNATGDVRKAVSGAAGGYTFVNLPIGTYRLTVTRAGYQTSVIEHVAVHAAQTADLPVTLKVGAQDEKVEVSASTAALLETSTNSIETIVDLKQIQDLPMNGRDLTNLARTTSGYAGYGSTGSWNGQPLISQGSNIDGTIGQSSRMKIFGAAEPVVMPRLEDIEEMSVQTDQLDLDQGFGVATTQINFVTRRGTNKVHGSVFENFHNSGLNANSYANNMNKVRRAKSIYNDFGATIGGHLLSNRLFYFGSFAVKYIPGGSNVSNSKMLTSTAQGGVFTYTDAKGTLRSIDVLSLAKNYSSSLPSAVNSTISSQMGSINGIKGAGVVSTISDPNLQRITWYNSNTDKTYYPTVRLDYVARQNLRMNLSWSMTEDIQPGANRGPYPGSAFEGRTAGNKVKNYTSSYGADWMISQALINQLKVGFLYNATFNNYNASKAYQQTGFVMVDWALGDSGQGSGDFQLPLTSYYPAFNLTDTVTLQKGKHSAKFGFTGYREQDHYWNAPTGFPDITLGLVNGDPAKNAFSTNINDCTVGSLPCANSNQLAEAQNLYATLVGRISKVGGSYAFDRSSNGYARKIGSYALNEVTTAWGLFAQDSWRILPNVTLNYGLRWDFTGESKDKSSLYHSAETSSVYGPTAPADLFKPGSLNGNLNPTLTARSQSYEPFHVTPQPAIGLAWNPKSAPGMLGKIIGEGKTALRAGYSLRRFTEPYQYYWNNASDQGAFYYQSFSYFASNTGVAGTFTPGSMTLGNSSAVNPNNFSYQPTSYQTSVPQATYTFLGNAPGGDTPGVTGMDEHIKQPYTQTWNFGVQRSFGTRVLELRYAGNRTLHQWVNDNTNEVNIFENGFLTEFKQAQANLNAYRASNKNCDSTGTCSFANNGLAGQGNVPTINAAFAGEASGGVGIPAVDYANSTLISFLDTGQAGGFAQYLTTPGTVNYFCNLVGSSFTPCTTNGGYSGGSGAAKAINLFQSNPYATGQQTQYMKAAGYSSYHSLQVDLRQQQWHGLQSQLNYTWSHTLGYQVNTNGTSASGYGCGYYGYSGWCGWPGTLTLRNRRLAYGPAQFDIRHAFHLTGTYDLPVGRGKMLLSQDNLVSNILGNWTVGFLATFQTGTAQQLIGNNLTYNDYGDGGVVLNNITVHDLQKAVGVHRMPGKTYALLLDPKYLQNAQGTGGANTTYISSNTKPGTINHPVYLYGPHAFYNDLSLSKNFRLFREYKMKIQSEATNVWNHPVFGSTSGSFGPSVGRGDITASGWATSEVTNSPRVVEFRATIEF